MLLRKLSSIAKPAALRGLTGARSYTTTFPQAKPNYGSHVFTDSKLQGAVGASTFAAFKEATRTGKDLEKKQKNEIASAILQWAVANGCTQMAHIFYPIRGNNPAWKYDSFIDLEFGTKDWSVPLPITPELVMSGSKLMFAESDGSSYPSGDMRATHEAASYSAWDRTSPCFIRDRTLFVPAVFVTWTGRAQDEKTPLLRSQRAINDQGIRLLKHLGYKDVKGVVTNVGCEQEFFLISKDMYEKRPDLVATGRTLIGAKPPHGQQFSNHYFAKPNRPVKNFFYDLQKALWELNISLIVMHNEVAPSQHEFSPIFTLTNIAADQNLLSHEVMGEIANKHGLVCLLHEKPFAGLNGNGKHNNWGLNTLDGRNLYVPGKNEQDQACFVAQLAVLARAVKKHGDLLRLGVATPQNDLRLGAHEAPPGIMSLYVGKNLENWCRKVASGGKLEGYGANDEQTVDTGCYAVPPLPIAPEDRNRTAPFPWCGNRFEFRAVGSSQSINWPITILHTIVADSMSTLSDSIEKGKSVRDAVGEMMKENIDAFFSGNNYDPAWHEEAEKKRGLASLKNTYQAVSKLSDEKNIKVFKSQKIFESDEVLARQSILFENYIQTIQLEADVLLRMLHQDILPAVNVDLMNYTAGFSANIKRRQETYSALEQSIADLENAINNFPNDAELKEQARYAAETLRPQVFTTRKATDAAEILCSRTAWPYPSYTDILYSHHQIHA